MKKKINFQFSTLNFIKGQTIIELLVVMGILAIILPALLTGLVSSREGKTQQYQRLKAISLLKEEQEAIRNVREKGWKTNIEILDPNKTYYANILADNSWGLIEGSEQINGFTRYLKVENVSRDTSGNIVQSGGTNDPSTKKITATVSWNSPIASSITSTTYLTRYLENASYTETTQTQFNQGTKTGITVRATNPPQITDDGEIILSSGGHGNWCDPTLTSINYNVTGNGVSTGIGATEGTVLLSTGENASGPDMIKLGISNPPEPTPPEITEQGSLDQNLKANDVFLEKVGSTIYGYIGSDDNGSEIKIVDATNNPFTAIGNINVSGSNDVKNVMVVNSLLYFTTERKLYTYSVANRASPQYKSEIEVSGSINGLYVVDEYAYLATTNENRELEVIKVTNGGATLSSTAYANTNSSAGKGIIVNQSGNRAYLITAASSDKREVFIINAETKSGSLPIIGQGFDTNGMDPKGVTLVPGNRLIVVGHGGNEYQVINIDTESSPILCGYEDSPDNLNGVTTIREADGDAYSYLITTNSDREFRIIVGGPGGSYAEAGIFESQTFNPGYITANNRLSSNFSIQSGVTTIKFQVSLANLVNGICPTTGGYTFIGPDGTSATYFTQNSGESITFPFTTINNYSNPGQCMRYKVFLSTIDPNYTPVLNDVTVNYSP